MLEHRERRILVWVLLGVLVLVLLGGFGPWGWAHYDAYGMMGAGWAWMPAMMILVLLLVLMALGLFRPHGPGPWEGPHGGVDARAILDRRYASGELSREEYQRMRDDLERRP